MNSTEYFKNVHRTESPNTHAVPIRILHGAVGICTEAGEVMDTVKKSMFYGRWLDKTNLKEELGDLLWYMGLMCSELGVSFEQLMDENIRKLKARYPEQFTQADEQGRDYGKEAEAVQNITVDKPIASVCPMPVERTEHK